MGFFGRLKNGWHLGLKSLGVVMNDKTLMLFPVFSIIASLAAVASFVFGIGPEELVALFEEIDPEQGWEGIPPAVYVLVFAFYFSMYFITVYFNVALLGAAHLSIGGKDTGPMDGISVANRHLPQIITWALISGTVGLVLNILENNQRIGRLVALLLGTAWTVLTFFVVPVMIFEDSGPVSAIRRSVSVMKKTWGENLGAQFSVGMVPILLWIVSAIVLFTLSALFPQLAIVLVPLVVLLLIFTVLLTTTAKSVLMVGLYHFAVDGEAPGAFSNDELGHAFGMR